MTGETSQTPQEESRPLEARGTAEDPNATFSAGQAAYAVKLPTFEGPLDLLLHLCRENELDVTDLPIAMISTQYLEYLELMRSLDIDIAAEYLLMAATLAHIKSRLLLPPQEGDEDEDEGLDPREELARRLAAFAVFREAADVLGRRPLLGRDVFGGQVDLSEIPSREPTLVVDLSALVEGMRRVLAALPEAQRAHAVQRERFTLQECILDVMDVLGPCGAAGTLFETILAQGEPSKARVIMSFLAILELARTQVLRIYQHIDERGVPSGPIRVRPAAVDGDATAPEHAVVSVQERPSPEVTGAASEERPGDTDPWDLSDDESGGESAAGVWGEDE